MVHVRQIWLQNFRNYDEQQISFGKGTIIVFGLNGQGKTNLVEAINYLGTATSFRGVPVESLIRDGSESATIRADVLNKKRELLVEAQISRAARNTISINKQKISPIRNLIGLIPTTIFGPDDLSLIKEGPAIRRNYIDHLLIQINPNNMKLRVDLDQVLKQRNALLKNSRGKISERALNNLEIWNDQFNKLGHEWAKLRKKTLIQIKNWANDAYAQLSGTTNEITMRYNPEWDEVGLEKALFEVRNEEFRRGTTLVGPHRDEISIGLGNLPARTHASQGEQRTIALALRVAGHHLLSEIHNTKPVLLLDDVFSELDKYRTDALLQLLIADQTFITTAVELTNITSGTQLHVSNGKIL